MKAKTIIYLLSCGCLLFTARAQNSERENVAITKIKSFYIAYISSILQGPTAENEQNFYAIQKKYLTQRLINKVGTNPYATMYTKLDPFLKANECDGDWIKTLVVKKNNGKPNSYIVTYLYLQDPLKRKKFTKSITYVGVVNDGNDIKIDSVW